jgi:hypothetical protein
VLLTVLKMDAGPIVRQVAYPLTGDEKVRQRRSINMQVQISQVLGHGAREARGGA